MAIGRLLPMNALSGTMSFLNDFCLLVVKAGRSYVCDALNLTYRCRNVCTNYIERTILSTIISENIFGLTYPPHIYTISTSQYRTPYHHHCISASHHLSLTSCSFDTDRYLKVCQSNKNQKQEMSRARGTKGKSNQEKEMSTPAHPTGAPPQPTSNVAIARASASAHC